MNLSNIWSGVTDFFSNLFNPKVVSPLPEPQQTQSYPSWQTVGTQSYSNPSQTYSTTPTQSFQTQSFPLYQPLGNQSGNQSNLDPHINPATGQWDDNYYAQTQGGGSFVDQILQAVTDPLQAEIESWWKRLDEYDKNNPFAFDEALARASAEERLNPYYDATMNEFMQGVRASSTRSVEDMTRTIGELNVDASKLSDKERLATQEAIRSSEEGFAGSGLFFSGKRQRQTGLQEVSGLQTQEGIQTNLERSVASSTRSNTRLQEDLALQKARQERLTEAERTTALETDIAKQKKESAYQRALEQAQFAGSGTGLSTAQRMQLENQFLSGLQ